MADYQCPLCGKTVERDLAVFLSHTDTHIVDEIKKKYPEWVSENGACRPCIEYYEAQMAGAGLEANIGPVETRKRIALSIFMLIGAVSLLCWQYGVSADRAWRLLLFFPAVFGLWTFLQARFKTCSVLSELGVANLDTGNIKIKKNEIADKLRAKGRKIAAFSVVSAVAVTMIYYFLP